MRSESFEDRNGSIEPAVECFENRHASMDELLEGDWEELVIKFDREKGQHVVRTACCPMAQAC